MILKEISETVIIWIMALLAFTGLVQNQNITVPKQLDLQKSQATISAVLKSPVLASASASPSAKPAITSKPTPKPVETINQSNIPPGSGFSVQNVAVEGSTFKVSIIAADLNSTRVIVDTASDSDCGNDCPVMSLAEYVSRNGAFAGINGSFFCPAAYESCAGKINAFDTLLMNKDKKYFNSDNNVYSSVPAVIFSGTSARFVGQSLEWGRDTSVDSVIANYPLLVSGGNVNFHGSDDGKLTGKGPRCFIGATDSTVYIGIVHGATSADAAKVIQAMGIQNALGLDQGGSTALWYNGYKAGPGRGIPNAVLFVNR